MALCCGGREFPLDVFLEILVWLPVKILIRFKSVCKDWYNLISSSPFIILYRNNNFLESNSRLHNRSLFYTHDSSLYIIDDFYYPFKITKFILPISTRLPLPLIASCNGLLCFGNTVGGDHHRFLIFNPSLRTFKQVLLPFYSSQTQVFVHRKYRARGTPLSLFLSYGFGYDSEHDDYKIVMINRFDGHVCVYNVKADLWRCATPTCSPTGLSQLSVGNNGIYKNNMLHYLLVSTKVKGGYEKEYRIVRFDLSSETWRDELRFPFEVDTSSVELGDLDGLIYLRVGEYYCGTDVWIMKEYGVEESWTKMFSLPENVYSHALIALSKKGRPRLLVQDLNIPERCGLRWYDRVDDKMVAFKLKGMRKDVGSRVQLCIPSLDPIPGSSLAQIEEIIE